MCYCLEEKFPPPKALKKTLVSFHLAVQGRGEVVPGPLQHKQQVEHGRHRAGVEAERG